MAQNLNYATTNGNSWCYNDTASYCTKYGRLYDFSTAKLVCPSGWHLPDTTEWNTLEAAVGGYSVAGTALKSDTGWAQTGGGLNGNGANTFDFSALPGGMSMSGNPASFYDIGTKGYWWTSCSSGIDAIPRIMNNFAAGLYLVNIASQYSGLSVRCLKD